MTVLHECNEHETHGALRSAFHLLGPDRRATRPIRQSTPRLQLCTEGLRQPVLRFARVHAAPVSVASILWRTLDGYCRSASSSDALATMDDGAHHERGLRRRSASATNGDGVRRSPHDRCEGLGLRWLSSLCAADPSDWHGPRELAVECARRDRIRGWILESR